MARRHGWELPFHTFLAFSVFMLYVRCTAIDPSDPGILLDADKTSRHTSQFNGELPEPNKIGLQVEGMSGQNDSNRCPKLGCFFCGFLGREDCRSNEDILQQQSGDEGTLFCTLCNAEVHDACEKIK